MLAARERGRAERGIHAGEIVVAESAHAAFHKSAHLFDMPIRTVPVGDDWTVDLDAMAAAVTDRTVLVVGSAPQYPQGVVDPIPAIAELAASVGRQLPCRCVHGWVRAALRRDARARRPGLGLPGRRGALDLGRHPQARLCAEGRVGDPPPDEGAAAGTRTWVFDAWLGGLYGSPNLQGTRSGLPMAAAWAVMQHLGVDGYVRADTLDLGRREPHARGDRRDRRGCGCSATEACTS